MTRVILDETADRNRVSDLVQRAEYEDDPAAAADLLDDAALILRMMVVRRMEETRQ